MKLLIIEDESQLMQVMKTSLERAHFHVETADNYFSALDKIIAYPYDCILLDIMLPGGSGLELLSEIKKLQKTEAIIIISAKDAIEDKVLGLELGADDYLTKPFHLAELTARVKSVIRRKNQAGRALIQYKNLCISPEDRSLKINQQEVLLNRKEFDLLYYFITNPDRLITKTAISEYVWGDHTDQYDRLDFVYSQIKNLRKKLKTAQADVEIQAIYGVGYKFK